MNRRDFARLIAALAATGLALPARAADPAFKKLTALLVDLPGWEGSKPEGMAMETGDGAMITAERKYTKDPARMDVAVMVGATGAGVLGPLEADMKMETDDGHMMTTTWKGLRAMLTFQNHDKSGALIAQLGEMAAFVLNYSGMT
jgi:hypothetical protein